MNGSPNIAKIGALIGDNTRARMLSTLMHGKALTATELARDAGITAQTASSHLAKLESGGLLVLQKQGRHKYFALANAEIAELLETIMGLTADSSPLTIQTGPRDLKLRTARVCYNHLAGTKGVQLYDSLIKSNCLQMQEGIPVLSDKGRAYITKFGIDLTSLQKSSTPLCRTCLDWSERRTHLAGSLGRTLFTRLEELNWLKRGKERIVRFDIKGEREFNSAFPV